MTESEAIFVIGLVGVALALSAGAVLSRRFIIGLIAGFLWIIIAVDRMVSQSWEMDYILSTFCLVVAIVMFLTPLIFKRKVEIPTEVKKTNIQIYNEKAAEFRKARRAYRGED